MSTPTATDMSMTTFVGRYPELAAKAIIEEWATRYNSGAREPRPQMYQYLWDTLVATLSGDVESAVTYVLETGDDSAEFVLGLVGVRPTRVVVHQLDRNFGGSEEGGWWFDSGTVELDREIGPDEDLDALTAELEERYSDKGNRYSMAPRGTDYSITFGHKPGVNYPVERPHYE